MFGWEVYCDNVEVLWVVKGGSSYVDNEETGV